jgi:hypothetical protein
VSTPSARLPWWKTAVYYQIYPRSFADSNGDGIGDLGGIRARLDHLAWLGVDALWLSPVYPSPMADFGYHVADHCDVDPLFGTLADLDALVADSHALGLRVIPDFVPNHTLLAARRASLALRAGGWQLLETPAGILGFVRACGADMRTVLVNFTTAEAVYSAPGIIEVASDGAGEGSPCPGFLAAEQAIILRTG